MAVNKIGRLRGVWNFFRFSLQCNSCFKYMLESWHENSKLAQILNTDDVVVHSFTVL